MKKLQFLFFFFLPFISNSQSYTSYFTGNIDDTITSPLGGICMMGGATEDDNAMLHCIDDAILFHSMTSGVRHGLIGVPMEKIKILISKRYQEHIIKTIISVMC